MLRDRLKQTLRHIGIPAQDHAVLELLPLIYVAWADGKMENVQRDRIHAFAVKHFDLGPQGFRVLESWLRSPPSREYIAEGLHGLYRLACAPDDGEVELTDLPELLAYAEGIARTVAHALDRPEAVTERQEQALEEIARELHIDHGMSWAKLLRELSSEQANQQAGQAQFTSTPLPVPVSQA